ncbi:hypothetical protein FRC16_000820 [Serendipita sp. 398]|nr:hypothetical protein FRC16_000820 [Serendipita sp. 398]
MWSYIVLSVVLGPSLAVASPSIANRAQIVGRDVQLLNTYDYVIVGAGAAGLTVANRLSEDPKVNVLVLEAGDLDHGEDEILIPRYALGAPGKYFYNIPSVPLPGLNNRSELLTSGKVVGGGTAVNGMFMPRGAKGDYDIWKELGNPGWGWSDLLPYFIKSETFTPPSAALATEFEITYDMRYHGTKGPVQSSYPPFLYPAVKLFLRAIRQFGSHVPYDYASGDALGAYWAPNTLDPVSRTRSYARTAYYDPIKSRSNLHLLPNNTVTNIIFNGKTATGVKFSNAKEAPIQSVSACREVIIAAGAPHTPQLLQLSGVGPKKLLNSFGIPIVSDLPGATRDLLIKYTQQGKIAAGEFIGGTGASMGLVLLKPFSRGSLTIKSKEAFDDPVVDFGTLRNPLDLDVMTEMIKAWRRMLLTPALQTMGSAAISPADNITSTADLQAFVRANLAASLWHPSGSAPMMKKELGGVVGPDLLVYGTKGLSIIDASILPICPSTHITTTMYAVAEKAADIIKLRAKTSP